MKIMGLQTARSCIICHMSWSWFDTEFAPRPRCSHRKNTRGKKHTIGSSPTDMQTAWKLIPKPHVFLLYTSAPSTLPTMLPAKRIA